MNNPDWSDGYVTDTIYTEKFFRELSPAWLNYVAMLNGIRPPDVSRPFRYLELGCGFGTSAIVNAAAFPGGEFHACDFNPAHIEGGRRRAAEFEVSNIRFHEAGFEQLLSQDLPPFEFIALHGVYSWVGEEARQAIRRVIYEKLLPGGLLYLSYNCLPGWAVEAPLRKLLVELTATESGNTQQRAEYALRSLNRLKSSNLKYFNASPAACSAVEAYTKSPSNYLVHEFLNQAWEPFYSIDVLDEMQRIEMSYAGSATLADNHPGLVIQEAASEAIARLETPRQQHLATDFAADRRFRRDVFVRTRAAQVGDGIDFNSAAIGRIAHRDRIGLKIHVPRGVITFQEDFIHDLQELLTSGSMKVGEAVSALSGENRSAGAIARNLAFLVAAGALMPFAKVKRFEAGVTSSTRGRDMLERIIAHSLEHRIPAVIPSEIAGNGILIEPPEALAISEWLAGAHDVEELAKRLGAGMERSGLAAVQDGKATEGREDLAGRSRRTALEVIEYLIPSLVRLELIGSAQGMNIAIQ